ncbi:MAG: PQQ-binding-like beta-propeller repeat protein [Phycisphaerae bacterium]
MIHSIIDISVTHGTPPAVVPVLIGPLQVLLAMLPAIVIAVFSTIVSLLRPSAVKSLLRLLWRLKLQVAAVALVVVGLWWGAGVVFPSSPTTRSSMSGPAEAGADWPVFRGNFRRTGRAPDSEDPTSGGINWRYTSGNEAYLSSPAVVGDRVYFTTALIEMGGGQGEIVCLDADTGELVWKVAPDSYDATFSSPTISGDYLVVGEGLHTTTDARVICISLAPESEGQILWSYRTQSHVESTPLIHDGKVYVGAGDKEGYYCFALEGDGNGNPKVLWHQVGDNYRDAETSLAAAGDSVYAGLGNDGKALVEFDADTGEERNRLPMPYPVFSPPAIVDGKLYVGCGNGDFAMRAEQLGLPTAGQLVCVDLETFKIDWSYDLPDTVLGSPAVADGKVYVGCRNGELFCLSTDGKLIRKHPTGAEILTSPAVGERTVYFVSTSGVLQAFDTRTGRSVWERIIGNVPTGQQFGYISSPAIARNRIYVGTQFDGLLCVGEAGEPAVPVWSSARGGSLQGSLNGVPLPEVASFLGQFPTAPAADSATATVKASPAMVGRSILVPLSDAGSENGLACVRPGDAGVDRVWSFPAELGVYTAPVAIGSAEGKLRKAFFVDGKKGQDGRTLRCLDANGDVLWRRPVAPDTGGALYLTDRCLYAQVDQAGTLSRFSLEGELRWTAETGPIGGAMVRQDNLLVVPVEGPVPEIVILDAPTGKILLRTKLKARKLLDVVAHRGHILAATDRGILPIDPADPSGTARTLGPPAAGKVTLAGDTLWYVSSDAKLVRLDLQTKKVAVGPEASPRAPLIVGSTLLYLDAQTEIRMLPADPSLPLAEAAAPTFCEGGNSWLGRPTTPMLSAGGRVYLGFTGMGLCVLGGSN